MMAASLRATLLTWYDAHARDLPWRRTRDPYSVWVSEIMLQQTRVDTVIPYYERFLSRFPTATDLAAADEDEVLAVWSGLGYYRRARLLHRGVREVVARYGGCVPADAAARRSLPGVGRYTAGAIGSIAFGRAEPIVDGNIARVLSRLHRIQTQLGLAETERRLWTEAAALVSGPRPGALNQSLMELGATVCLPRQPQCSRCPIQGACRARAAGLQDKLPVPRRKAPPKPIRTVVVVPRTADNAVWLVKQHTNLFGGLWSLPMAEGDSANEALVALAEAKLEAHVEPTPAGRVTHVLSHRRFEATVFRAQDTRGEPDDDRRPFAREDFEEVGLSRFTTKALATTEA